MTTEVLPCEIATWNGVKKKGFSAEGSAPEFQRRRSARAIGSDNMEVDGTIQLALAEKEHHRARITRSSSGM